jgi:hypothetical protein
VYKFDQSRIESEMEWISRAGCFYLFFADANWGMLKRDLDLSRHLAECKRRWGAPLNVYFAGAKNTPDRVGEITRVFYEAGMVATQSIALQTMNPESLRQVNRDNIKAKTYTELQSTLNAQGISSFLEMIWPLPGETLDSFRDGLAALCSMGADSFLIYPLLLVNNVEMNGRREEHGFVTRQDPDPSSEAEIVIGTRDVSSADYEAGIRFSYALTVLYSLRGLWRTGRYLDETGKVPYVELFKRFTDFCRARPSDPYVRYCEGAIETFDHYKFNNVGGVMHLVLHAAREAFDELLAEFAREQEWWDDPLARALFEIDLVARPYLYLNTSITPKRHAFEHLRVSARATGYIAELTSPERARVRRYLEIDSPLETGIFELHHRRDQLPYMTNKPLNEHHAYGQDMLHKMRSLLPRWMELPAWPRRRAADWLSTTTSAERAS